jgi:hypothetical protein
MKIAYSDKNFTVYDEGEDWAVVGKGWQFYRTKWQADVGGSLQAAIDMGNKQVGA